MRGWANADPGHPALLLPWIAHGCKKILPTPCFPPGPISDPLRSDLFLYFGPARLNHLLFCSLWQMVLTLPAHLGELVVANQWRSRKCAGPRESGEGSSLHPYFLITPASWIFPGSFRLFLFRCVFLPKDLWPGSPSLDGAYIFQDIS